MRKLWCAFAVAVAVLALAGCGGESEAEEAEEAATPQEAVEEIGEVRTLLAQAMDEYRQGDAEDAEQLVGDAYLEHFEHVEHPLEERDRELMEELEVLISTRIREAMKEGAPPEDVQELVDEANEKLDEAERLLEEEA